MSQLKVSVLERMRADLGRALRKPEADRRWVMAIDLRKCVGCSSCTVSCIAENALPPGVVYRKVGDTETGSFPRVTRRFLPVSCNQCDNPPCLPVCPVTPTKATTKRPDGIVVIDYDKCIGCGRCVAACPYQARTLDGGRFYTSGNGKLQPYEERVAFEYGQRRRREKGLPPIAKARKCHFCTQRVAAGQLPACVSTCMGAAAYFGDANDPKSLVRSIIGRPGVMRLKEGLGTQPRVYYLT